MGSSSYVYHASLIIGPFHISSSIINLTPVLTFLNKSDIFSSIISTYYIFIVHLWFVCFGSYFNRSSFSFNNSAYNYITPNSFLFPSMVWVFPAPVEPYANIVIFIPLIKLSTVSAILALNMSINCVYSGNAILSYANWNSSKTIINF